MRMHFYPGFFDKARVFSLLTGNDARARAQDEMIISLGKVGFSG